MYTCIDAHLREYVAAGFARGTVSVETVIPSFIIIGEYEDGGRGFGIYGRTKNWRDHQLLDMFGRAFDDLHEADKIVLNNITGMSLSGVQKFFVARMMVDKLIATNLHNELDASMEIIIREGKGLHQRQWEYDQVMGRKGIVPSESIKTLRRSKIGDVIAGRDAEKSVDGHPALDPAIVKNTPSEIKYLTEMKAQATAECESALERHDAVGIATN